MTEEEILEGNLLIAEFLKLDVLYGNSVRHESAQQEGWVTPMKYHKSWDWLMPVVEKISKSTGYDFVINTATGEVEIFSNEGDVIIEGDEDVPIIESTWLAIVNFIKWYNQQKK